MGSDDGSGSAQVGNDAVGSAQIGDDAGGSTCDNCIVDGIVDGINMHCSLVDGKVPIRFKICTRKAIWDRGCGSIKSLTNALLQVLVYYEGTDEDTKLLLTAWHDSKTPLVLKCLIADALHKYKRQEELGPLPDFYIPLQKQNHPHPQKEGVWKAGDTVSCLRCDARGVVCKCK